MTTHQPPPPPSKPAVPPAPRPATAEQVRRREWAAALRWAANLRGEPTHSPGAVLLGLANQIEAGYGTPWTDQPEPDEPVADVLAAFERGPHGVTSPPPPRVEASGVKLDEPSGQRTAAAAAQALDLCVALVAPTPPAPDGAGPILGRALLDRFGDIWRETPSGGYRAPDADEHGFTREYLERKYGPVREVLLVDPAVAGVLDAAQRWVHCWDADPFSPATAVAKANLATAVDALPDSGTATPTATGEASAQAGPGVEQDTGADVVPVSPGDLAAVAYASGGGFRRAAVDFEPALEPDITEAEHDQRMATGEPVLVVGTPPPWRVEAAPPPTAGTPASDPEPAGSCGCRTIDEHHRATEAMENEGSVDWLAQEFSRADQAFDRLPAWAQPVVVAKSEPTPGPVATANLATASHGLAKPNPLPAGGPGWDRTQTGAALHTLWDDLHGLVTDGLEAALQVLHEQVPALLADRDDLAAVAERVIRNHDDLAGTLRRERNTARAEVRMLSAELERVRNELAANAPDEVDRWIERHARVVYEAAEVTARLRAALDAGQDVPEADLVPLAGTYREALAAAVRANQEQTAEAERLRAELARVRRELAEVQGRVEDYRRDAWDRTAAVDALRAELATARRDAELWERAAGDMEARDRHAAADTLDWAAGEWHRTAVGTNEWPTRDQLHEWAAEVRAGTRPVPGGPQPDGAGGEDPEHG